MSIPNPRPQQIMETVIGAARHVRRFGMTPKIALCTQSQFGNMDNATARRMRDALELLDQREPDFAYEGEMNIDAALDQSIRDRLLARVALRRGRERAGLCLHPRSPRACATS